MAFFQGCSLRGAGALVIAWLFGAAAFAATISGRVYEEASAPPNQSYSSAEDAALNLQSVRVQCVGGYSADQQTDSAGAFSFVNVPDGGNCTLRRISDGTSTIAYKVPGAGGVAGPGAAGTTADNVINFPNVPAGGSANNLLAYERASDRLKSFVIGKYLTGPISTVDGSILGYVAGTKFPITLVCRDSASASGNVVFGPIDLMLAPSETFEIKPTATTPGVPADVFCTLTEGTFPATTATNYEYVAPTFPSNFTCSSSAPTSDNSFGGSKRLTAGGTSTFAPTPRGETCAGTFDVNNTIVDTDAGALIFGRVYSELSVPPNLVDNGSSVDLGIKDVSISAVCTDPVTNVVSNRGPVLTDSQGQYEFRVPPGNRCVVTETQPANYKNAYNGNPPEATASTGGTAGSTGNSSITVQVTGLQNVGGVNFAETPGAGTATLAVGKRYIESGRGILVTGDPTYFTTAPSITVTVTCSVTGLHSLTFTAPTTQGDTTTTINDPNVITGLAAGEVCGTFTETFTGQVLSGSYTFTGPTQFQDGGTYTALPLTELTMKFGANALRVDNTFVPPPNGTLTIRKVYEGDVSKVIAYPTVGVNLICVIDGDPTEQTFPVPLQPDPAGSGNLPLSFPVPPILACRVGDEVFIDGVVAAGYTIIGPTNVTPAGFVRIASNVETIFTVTNKVVLDTQVVTVNKTVTGAPSTGAPGAYAMSIACAAPTTGPFTGTVTLTGSAVTGATTISIPGGATDCLTTETSKPTAPTGYSWGSATLPASFATTAGGSNAVTVSNPLIAGAHTVTVTKTVTGALSTGAPGAYAMSIACAAPNAGPFTGTVTLSGAATTGTTTVSIPAGATSCATTETSKATAPTGYSWGAETLPASFATTAGGSNAVTVSNPLIAGAHTVTVTKTVTGAPSTGAPGAYVLSIACAAPNAGPFTGTVTLSGTATTGTTTVSIPAGATGCATTETSKATAPTGYSWGTETLPATFATTAGGSNAVTVTNPLIAGAHTVTVTKTVTGAPSTGAPGAYVLSIACAAPNAGPFTGTVTLSGTATTATTTISIPAGATGCATTETSKATAPTGYSWGTETLPATFATTAGGSNAVTVSNPLIAGAHTVTVTKTVTGAPSTGAPGAYAMSIACAAPNAGPFTGTVTLSGAATTGNTTVSIPAGATSCATTETSKATAPTGYSWGAETLPATFATTAGGSNAVTVSNPLIAGAHTVTVTKTVTGAPSTGAPGAYALSIACAAPNAGPFTGTVTLAGTATTGTTTVSIPAGATSCATTETSKATAPTGYSWGSATLPASFATTAGGNNAVTVTNPLNVAAADMQSSVSCVPTTPVIGGMVKCTVTCTNAGPNAAINAFCSVPNAAILPGAPSAVCPSSPSSALAVGAKLVCTIQFVATASAQTKVLGGSGATNDLDGGTAELAGNNGSAANVTPTAPLLEAQPIPTIGLTGMLAMMMMLVAVGLRRLRRH